jgi:hypothetical protein
MPVRVSAAPMGLVLKAPVIQRHGLSICLVTIVWVEFVEFYGAEIVVDNRGDDAWINSGKKGEK